ncbi:MAG: stage II sporulation protein R [Ruminococcus sp.]|nr:stage II sporulation protein R [Ruminococcus sp.]
MKKISCAIMGAGLILTIIISNICSFVKDGSELDELRDSVLRLHILANSDSSADQQLKLSVRDVLIERSDEIFGNANSKEEAEKTAAENLELIESIARETLSEQGCDESVCATVTDMYFDEREYGDITMPAGVYTAVRVEIGEAQGHNWWCVMYPPLCIPAACEETADGSRETADEFFDDDQKDIIYNPEKYKVRFAIWDKIKSWID